MYIPFESVPQLFNLIILRRQHLLHVDKLRGLIELFIHFLHGNIAGHVTNM